MIYTQSFIKIVSGIQKLFGVIQRHTDSLVSAQAYFNFFNKENTLKLLEKFAQDLVNVVVSNAVNLGNTENEVVVVNFKTRGIFKIN
jgi:hypothetical protein